MFGKRNKKTGLIYTLLAGGIVFTQPAMAESSSSLGGYTPPPMFGETRSNAVELPPETAPEELPEASGRPHNITQPSPRQLLGYKDMAYSNAGISHLPFPRRKPENIDKIVASRVAAENMPRLKKPEVDIDRVADKKKSGKEPTAKIVNESGLGIMDDSNRQKIVDMTIAAPLSQDSQKSSERQFRKANPNALMPPLHILEDVSKQEDHQVIRQIKPQDNSFEDQLDREQAKLLPETEPSSPKGKDLSLIYERGQTELNSVHKTILSENILSLLKNYPSSRLEIKAYADKIEDMHSGARRISLARALAIREFLLKEGVSADRMNLRALGDERPELASTGNRGIDRVDISLKSL